MIYYTALFMLLLSSPSYAYLDGGTANMLIQVIFGGVAGGLVFIKLYWQKIVSYFKKK